MTVTLETFNNYVIEPYKNAKKGSTIQAPAEPTCEGIFFKGWYASNDFITEWDFEQNCVDSDTTLYDLWEHKKIKIVYILDENSGERLNPDGDLVSSFYPSEVLNLNKAEKKGYTFKGWLLKPQAEIQGEIVSYKRTDLLLAEYDRLMTGLSTSSSDLNSISLDDEYCCEIFLYPHFVVVTILIVFRPFISGLDLPNVKTSYGAIIDFLPEDLKRDGYIFVGWYTNDGSSSGYWKVQVKNGDVVDFLQSCVLYARWGREY